MRQLCGAVRITCLLLILIATGAGGACAQQGAHAVKPGSERSIPGTGQYKFGLALPPQERWVAGMGAAVEKAMADMATTRGVAYEIAVLDSGAGQSPAAVAEHLIEQQGCNVIIAFTSAYRSAMEELAVAHKEILFVLADDRILDKTKPDVMFGYPIKPLPPNLACAFMDTSGAGFLAGRVAARITKHKLAAVVAAEPGLDAGNTIFGYLLGAEMVVEKSSAPDGKMDLPDVRAVVHYLADYDEKVNPWNSADLARDVAKCTDPFGDEQADVVLALAAASNDGISRVAKEGDLCLITVCADPAVLEAQGTVAGIIKRYDHVVESLVAGILDDGFQNKEHVFGLGDGVEFSLAERCGEALPRNMADMLATLKRDLLEGKTNLGIPDDCMPKRWQHWIKFAGADAWASPAGLAWVYSRLPNPVEFGRQRSRYEAVVQKVRESGLAPGQEKEFKVEDLSRPETFRPRRADEEKVRGLCCGDVYARMTGAGELQAAITTVDYGHAGECGYVYSEKEVQPQDYPGADLPGFIRMLRKQLDESWWIATDE